MQNPFIVTAKDARAKRAENMTAARNCLAVITNPDGFWKYTRKDPRTLKSMAYWVRRAKRWHNIALGREPLVTNFAAITGGEIFTGKLYAVEA